MPGTNDLIAPQVAGAQAGEFMRAGILERIESLVVIDKDELAIIDRNTLDASGLQLLQGSDFSLGHHTVPEKNFINEP